MAIEIVIMVMMRPLLFVKVRPFIYNPYCNDYSHILSPTQTSADCHIMGAALQPESALQVNLM